MPCIIQNFASRDIAFLKDRQIAAFYGAFKGGRLKKALSQN